jgi:hypothetical protein
MYTRLEAPAARPPPARLFLLAAALLAAAGLPAADAAPKTAPRKRPAQTASAWRALRNECAAARVCPFLPGSSVEDEDCILACQAPSCHAQVYAGAPLEPGEVDYKCVRLGVGWARGAAARQGGAAALTT